MKTLKIIFSGEKCLDNKILNILGIQSFRYLISKILYLTKFFFLRRTEYLNVFNNGFDKEQNFLDEKYFFKIREEYFKAIEDPKYSKKILQTNQQKESIEITSVDINESIKEDYPNLYNLKNNIKVNNFFLKCEQRKKVNIYMSLEKIETVNSLNLDTQKNYHYDTFYSTFKAWLYIDDVELNDGPFYYIKNSHKISFKRLILEWIFSIRRSFNKNFDDSFRYGNSLKNQKKLNDIAEKFIDKKNTFIMANTHGLHRRGDSNVNTVRNTIHFYSRENPFKIIQ